MHANVALTIETVSNMTTTWLMKVSWKMPCGIPRHQINDNYMIFAIAMIVLDESMIN